MSTATSDQRTKRKTQIGFVSSRSGDKSIKVTIAYKTPHPLYHKVVNRQTVLHVHDEKNETKVGDKVEVMAASLLEWETLDADQLNDIMAGKPPRAPKVAAASGPTPPPSTDGTAGATATAAS